MFTLACRCTDLRACVAHQATAQVLAQSLLLVGHPLPSLQPLLELMTSTARCLPPPVPCPRLVVSPHELKGRLHQTTLPTALMVSWVVSAKNCPIQTAVVWRGLGCVGHLWRLLQLACSNLSLMRTNVTGWGAVVNTESRPWCWRKSCLLVFLLNIVVKKLQWFSLVWTLICHNLRHHIKIICCCPLHFDHVLT